MNNEFLTKILSTKAEGKFMNLDTKRINKQLPENLKDIKFDLTYNIFSKETTLLAATVKQLTELIKNSKPIETKSNNRRSTEVNVKSSTSTYNFAKAFEDIINIDDTQFYNLDTMTVVDSDSIDDDGKTYANVELGYFSTNQKLLEQMDDYISIMILNNYEVKNRPKLAAKNNIKVKSVTTTIPTIRRSERLRQRLPVNIKNEVWANSLNLQGDNASCFCCLNEISKNNHQNGHVKPYHFGGTDSVDNIKSICESCNKSMSSLHMYEYMLRYNKKGVVNLPIDDDYIYNIGLVQLTNIAKTKLEKLILAGKISRTTGDDLLLKATSSKRSIDDRKVTLDYILRQL